MRVLENCEPKQVFNWFEELSKIPHGSGNIDAISDYLVNFAKERGLEVVQDDVKNVIIKKAASKGMEGKAPVLLQGHMDMVAVKDDDCDLDLEKDGLILEVDGDFISAKGTTLGGDDGIAVAYALAILDSDEIIHPPLEVLITTNEETGMDGAIGVDMSQFDAMRMVNLDSESEGILWAGCAGGMRLGAFLPVQQETGDGEVMEVTIHGLLGGHSGDEIHKERGNANVLLGRLLSKVSELMEYRLISLQGGCKDNAIAIQSSAKVMIEEAKVQDFIQVIKQQEEILKKEYQTKDPEITISVKADGFETSCSVVNSKDSKKIAELIFALPYGVTGMSADVPGLVETSLNLGIMNLEEQQMHLEYSLRSSVKSLKEALRDKMIAIIRNFGGMVELGGEYPAWEFRKDSPLRDTMSRVYSEMYGCEPRVAAIHAGLECGLFSEKKPGLDCVSIGPNMQDIHTTAERLSISSTRRVWDYLLAVLKALD